MLSRALKRPLALSLSKGASVVRQAHHERSRGQGMVEFALVFPLFLATLLLIFDTGRFMANYITLAHGVQNGVRAAIVYPCPANITNIEAAVNAGLLTFGNAAPTVTCSRSAGPTRGGQPTTVVTVTATMAHQIDPVFHAVLQKAFPTTATISHTATMSVESPF